MLIQIWFANLHNAVAFHFITTILLQAEGSNEVQDFVNILYYVQNNN